MIKLNEAYLRLKRILGDHAEPLESVQLVEAYRRYLRPEKVKVVLLAESHVYTSDEDRCVKLPAIPDLPGYPARYARFVYCLGYGERHLTGSPLHPRRDGTPQFWKIFFSCDNRISALEDFAPILGGTPDQQRVRNKVRLLSNLKSRGIWLVDASIVALYKEGKKAPNMFAALQESWNSYTREVIVSASPEHVICIGKGVSNIVEADLKRYFPKRYTVVAQPNAFLSSAEHMENFRTYSKICCG